MTIGVPWIEGDKNLSPQNVSEDFGYLSSSSKQQTLSQK